MTGNKHEFLTKFLNINPLVFLGFKNEDVHEFILACHERLHKLRIFHQHEVKFVTFQLQGEAMPGWRAYIECRYSTLSPLSWTLFHALFLEL